MSINNVIVAKSLTKKYGDFTAVDGISFEIQEGECFGFLGPNGAGKTTTIKMIHCVSPVTSGMVTVLGKVSHIDNRDIKLMTGVIPQEINLDGDLTVYENMMTKRRVAELLNFVELESRRNSKIDELSTGMKRRLLVARALLNKPKLIIADEPTTGLDPQARHLIWERLRSLKSLGTTLLLTTQYMEEAEQLCDRLVIMYQGRILKQGSPRKLVSDEIGNEVVEIRIAKEEDEKLIAQMADISCGHERVGDTLYFYCRDGHEVMKKIVDFNLPNVLNRPATLEDVFLKLTGRSLIE
jgi:lipooligosaccharide transport system ATP-binding protein